MWQLLILSTVVTIGGQTLPNSALTAPGVIDIRQNWPANRPFTRPQLVRWAKELVEQNRGRRYNVLRAATGPDAKELERFVSGREESGTIDYSNRQLWPSQPIAEVIAYGGRALLRFQAGRGFPEEEIIEGTSNLTHLEFQGAQYRLLHFQLEPNENRTGIAVFLQNEWGKPSTDAALHFMRLFQAAWKQSDIRLIIRPDAWAVDTSYPAFPRFVPNFGFWYVTKPEPPSPRLLYTEPVVDCRRLDASQVQCRSSVFEVHTQKYSM